jgi:hypothetical protein
VALAGAATWEYVDQTTAGGALATSPVAGSVTLNGFAVGVVTFE